MALTTPHITCGYAGGAGRRGTIMPVMRKPVWSASPASNVATTEVAPAIDGVYGDPLFSFEYSAAIYVSVGPTPNAAVSPRVYVKADQEKQFYCDPGDKAAWILA